LRRLFSEDVRHWNSSPYNFKVIKSVKMGETEHVARMGRKGNDYNMWLDIPGEKRSLVRPRCRWEKNNIVPLKSDGMALTE
jgi:hypothetical protein